MFIFISIIATLVIIFAFYTAARRYSTSFDIWNFWGNIVSSFTGFSIAILAYHYSEIHEENKTISILLNNLKREISSNFSELSIQTSTNPVSYVWTGTTHPKPTIKRINLSLGVLGYQHIAQAVSSPKLPECSLLLSPTLGLIEQHRDLKNALLARNYVPVVPSDTNSVHSAVRNYSTWLIVDNIRGIEEKLISTFKEFAETGGSC